MEKLCNICPRNCGVDRIKNFGFCQSNNDIHISKVMLHFFEEPPISGEGNLAKGSGAIFFSSCSLKCIYCQNSEISSKLTGKSISPKKLAEIFKQLEQSGANNINLVTPTHYTEQIIEAIKIYKPAIPIVWNTSGYEKPETIKMLNGFVDIFLTDLKYHSQDLSKKLSLAPDYFEYCSKSIIEMRKIQPKDVFENGLMKKGLIIRHLVLPNQTEDSLKIVEWIYNTLGSQTYVSLMAQFVPMAQSNKFPEINRKIKPLEYKIVQNKLDVLGFKNVFLQDFSSAETIYTPDFNNQDKKFKY